MSVSGTHRTALWLAIEDYSGLWEVVWELRKLRPDASEAELRRDAAHAVSALVSIPVSAIIPRAFSH